MTDLSNEIIDHGPNLWIHGHTHNSFDYTLGRTRVIVNPYGYKDVEVNPRYDKKLVLDRVVMRVPHISVQGAASGMVEDMRG